MVVQNENVSVLAAFTETNTGPVEMFFSALASCFTPSFGGLAAVTVPPGVLPFPLLARRVGRVPTEARLLSGPVLARPVESFAMRATSGPTSWL